MLSGAVTRGILVPAIHVQKSKAGGLRLHYLNWCLVARRKENTFANAPEGNAEGGVM